MEYDPFEIHMQLLALLRKLSASHQSIDNVVAFLVRYRDRCADDLWECVTDECQKGSLNTRINILYLLDTLLTTLQDLPAPSVAVPIAPSSSYAHQQQPTTAAVAAESYPEWLARDLGKLTGWVVPREKEGLLNLLSARQILESWKTKRLLPADVLTDALQTLEGRRALAHTHSAEGTPSAAAAGTSSSSKRRKKAGGEGFSTGETIRRMEEDRERHKRVRERLWVLPLPSAASTALSIAPPSAFSSIGSAPQEPPRALTSLLPSSVAGSAAYVLAAGEGAAEASPATSTTTPQSPFTPSPASTSLGGAGARAVVRAAGPVDRGGLERAVDREFEAGWEDEGAWDDVDREECQRENELCWPERIAGV